MQRIPLIALAWFAAATAPGVAAAQAATTGAKPDIGTADSDVKPDAIRNVRDDTGTPNAIRTIRTPIDMQVALFEETERVLPLAPANQVAWARAYASGAGRRADHTQTLAAVKAAFPDDPPGMHAQTHLLLQLIMTGDIVGALRAYVLQQERGSRKFSRRIVEKLDQLQQARSAVIREFARTKPPRAYAGSNPQTAARAQDRSARHAQSVQMYTQLINELQNTERELLDALQSSQRNLQASWESYAGMRDQDFRTSERVLQSR